MTLAQIMTLALRQLDEDTQDISEYDGAFRAYANIGYAIAVREYVKPRRHEKLRTDENGTVHMPEGKTARIAEIREEKSGRPLMFSLTADGLYVMTGRRNADIDMLLEVEYPELREETDEPMLPECVHHALADYICYRHLSTGSLAKQSRAKVFLQAYYKAMALLRPQGMGSVKHYRHLYDVTDIRYPG